MDDHFTVTIHDDKGVKQFNIHKLVKKALFYAALFLLSLIFISVGTILYLNNNINTMQHKRESIEKAYEELREKNLEIEKKMLETKRSLYIKKKQLDELSDSLSEIETLVGLKPIEDASLTTRINLTKLTFEQRATLLHFIPSGSPLEYHGITSKFGWRIHPTLKKREFHRGTDLKAKLKTPVYATADGIVEYAGYHKRSGFGNLVILQHMYGFRTTFAHLKKVVVKSGQFVKKGDLIAYSGNSGLSNGPHLHYEIRFMQRSLNPYYFIKWSQQNYYEIFKKEKKVPWQSLIAAMSQIKLARTTQTQPSSPQAQK